MSIVTKTAQQSQLIIDQDQAKLQIEMLGYGETETIYLRELLHKSKKKGKYARKFTATLSTLPTHQDSDKAIYFVVNGQGHDGSTITYGRALMFESDDKNLTLDEHALIWQKLGPDKQPSFQVQTRHSVHTFYCLDKPETVPIDEWKQLQSDGNDYLDTDKSIKDAPRLMRLAGGWHTEFNEETQELLEPVQCQLINVTGKKYSYQELRDIIPTPPKPVKKPKPKPVRNNDSNVVLNDSQRDERLVLEILDELPPSANGDENYEVYRQIACTLKKTVGEDEAIRLMYAHSPNRDWQQIIPSSTGDFNVGSIVKHARDLISWDYPDWWKNSFPPTPQIQNYDAPTKGKKMDFELEADRFRLELKSLSQENDPVKRTLKLANLATQKRISVKQLESLISTVSDNASRPKAVRHKIGSFIQLESGSTSTQLIPGIIGKGANLIAGEAGAGKTTIAYDLAGSVVTGEPFLGETPTQTGKVLIVSSDEGRSYAQDKLINRGLGGYSDEIEILEFWDVSQFQLLEEIISEIQPVLVIVDSFNAIHNDPNFDENSAQSSQTIKFLERLASIYNTTIVLTHHLNKCKDQKGLNRLRGSTAIAASVSVALILENADKGDMADTRKRLYSPKMRGGEPIDLLLDMNPHEGRFSLVNPSPGEETKPLCDQLMPFFTRNAGTLFEVKELETLGFTAKNNKYFYTALDRMVKRGQIVKRPSKLNPRSKVYGVSCTESSPSHHPQEDPPPYSSLLSDDSKAETLTTMEIEVSHHPSHHPVITQSSGQNIVQAETLTGQESLHSHHPGQAWGGGSKNCTEDSESVLDVKKSDEPLTWEKVKADIKCCLALLEWDKQRARDEIQNFLGLDQPMRNIADLDDVQLVKALHWLTDLACQSTAS